MHTQGIPLALLHQVHKRYGAQTALDGVDLSLHAGQVLALLGPNGAGKSTAVGLLLGMLQTDAGQATLFGLPPQLLAARRSIGVMLQSAGIPDTLRIDELLELTRSYYDDPIGMDECVALAGLEGLLPRRYGKLSGGQQRRVQFAMAICGRPRVLFLDEPTTGLDIEARQRLWAAIRALVADGCAVLLTTHYLEEAEALAHQVAVLHEGRIVANGSVAQIRERVSQRRIRCVSALDADDVGRWPEVQRASVDQGVLQVYSDRTEAVVARLLSQDPSLTGLEVHRAGLAEAFVELTRTSQSAEALEEAA